MASLVRALITAASVIPFVTATGSESAHAPSVRLPFTAVGDLVVLEARLNGSRALSFVLDSGAARMVLDTNVGRELKLPEGEPDTIGGAGAGRIPVRRIHGVDLNIGGRESKNYEFVSTDLSGVSSLINHRVDGILGFEFFSRFIVTVDYAKNELELRDSGGTERPEGDELAIRFVKGWPFVRATLNVTGAGEITDEFLIDSGSDDAVNHPIAARATDRRSTRTGNGLGSPADGFIATAARFRIGNHTLHDLPISSGGGTEQTSKLIGGAVLSRFTVTFDYPHSRIFLAPR